MIGTYLNERYRINSELGRGGMGVVYLARDTLLERDVAVKVMSATTLGTEGRARMMREAQATAQLNHPNIVTVHDAGETDGSPFIVMEWIQGETLSHRRPETLSKALAIACQLCAALEHAHEHAIIHRDLKPENVMILPDGSAKLMDFGLARSVASRLTTDGALVGTVFYLAPEQALGEEIDHRVDLYALGVMLYELTIGTLPFTAEEPFAVITQHLYAPVVPPQARNPEIPMALNWLIVQLLSKAADDRPGSATEVREALEQIASGEATPAIPIKEAEEPSTLDRIVRGRLVGREPELAEARALWQKTVSGEGQLLLVSGEPGIGKSRLVREVITRAEVMGGMTLVGECYAEGGAPYAPFAQVFRKILADGVEVDLDLPEYVLADLLTVAPDLRLRYANISPNPALDPQSEQQRLFENVVSFWSTLSGQSPLMFVLEDAHWADESTLALLRHLARRMRDQQVMLVATYREVELDEALPFQEVLLALNRERLANRIKLTRLDQQGTKAMLATLFAEEITSEFLEGIYRETEGNPFFIEEVVKALVRDGELYFEGGIWHRPAMDELHIPQSVRVAIQSRVSKLPGETQDMLRLSAVVGREFDFDTIALAGELDEDSLIDRLEQAERAQLIEEMSAERGGTFRFAHALIPATLKEGVSGLRRRRLHRRVATAVEELHPDDLESLAYQYAQAEVEGKALDYLHQAGDRARDRFANDDAIRFYTEALEFAEQDDERRFELLAARATVYDVVAHREEQLADVQAMFLLAEKLDDVEQFQTLLALADYYLVTEHGRSQEPIEEALALARSLEDHVWEARALQRLGNSALDRFDSLAARQALEKAVALFREADHLYEASLALRYLSKALWQMNDFGDAQQAAEEALHLSRALGDRREEARALQALASVYTGQSRFEEALAVTQDALALFRELGDKAGECNTLNNLGIGYGKVGEFSQQESCYFQALEIAEAINLTTTIQITQHNLVLCIFRPQGRYEEAMAFLQEMENKARQRNDEFLLLTTRYWQCLGLAAFGQYEQAVAMLEAAAPRVKQVLSSGPWCWTLVSICYFRMVLGQTAKARQDLTTVLELVEGVDIDTFTPTTWEFLGRASLVAGEKQDLVDGLEYADQAIQANVSGFAQDDLVNAYCVKAQLYLALFDLEGDADHLEQALTNSSEAIRLSQIEQDANLREEYHYTHARVLRATGREAEADVHLRKAFDRIKLVAGNTRDETLRQSWLENVPLNREIIAAAKEKGW